MEQKSSERNSETRGVTPTHQTTEKMPTGEQGWDTAAVKPTPSAAPYSWRDSPASSLSLRSEPSGPWTTPSTPAFKHATWTRGPPITPALIISGACMHESHRTTENRTTEAVFKKQGNTPMVIHLAQCRGEVKTPSFTFSLEGVHLHTLPVAARESSFWSVCTQVLQISPLGHWQVLAHSQLLGATKNKHSSWTITEIWKITRSLDQADWWG